jgi:hypothetical protein
VGFPLFILLNATQILMPSAFFPELGSFPFYTIILLCCLAASYRGVLAQLDRRTLAEQPISVCVLGLLLAVALSELSHLRLSTTREACLVFSKLVAYYLLLVANVDCAARLRWFLTWLMLLVGVEVLFALLQYHDVIDIAAFRPYDRPNDVGGAVSTGVIRQLRGIGVFSDPNDICLILVLSTAVCLYRMNAPGGGVARLGWLALLSASGYAFALTNSRGGFLGMVVGIVAFIYARFGLKKAIPLALLVLPTLFLLFAGRQTSLSTSGGTAQRRIQIWANGMLEFRGRPLFGIGFDRFPEVVHVDAHNSLVQAFTDLGFFGGMLFLGIFFHALWALNYLGSRRVVIVDPELRRLRPYMMMIVAGYGGGMFSISRAYIIPTYLVAGLAAVYLRDTPVWPPSPALRFSGRLVVRLAVVAAAFLAVLYLFVRNTARWGGG